MNSKIIYSPLISVITLVKNDALGLKKTILSVSNQVYENIEHIVIDGGCTDGTNGIISKNISNIDKWKSEPNCGISEALNKGIELSSGEWIIILNSGHTFFNPEVIQNIIRKNIICKYDLIFGDMVLKTSFGDIIKYSKPINTLWKGMSFSHQSSLIKADIFNKYKYDENYKYACDFELIFKLYIEDFNFKYISIIVSRRKIQGNTDSNIIKSTLERYQIVKQYRKELSVHLFYIAIIIKYTFRKIIPIRFLNIYYKIRYKKNILL